MRVFERIADLKGALRPLDREGVRIGFVPTMGALHEGHLSLVAAARSAGAEHVVASVFVNPKQFGPREDLARYPRDREGDLAKLERGGCDAVFFPTEAEMYPAGHQTRVEVSNVTQGLCGGARPGHFGGVTTVVLKLLHIVRPAVAVFGEKDLQQLVALRTMVRDLDMDIEVLGAPTVREPDGLARSSRNAYLAAEDRRRALALSRGLEAARQRYEAGERVADLLVGVVRRELEAAGLDPEYVELRALDDLAPLASADRPCALLVAAPVGSTRLIDNVILRRPVAPPPVAPSAPLAR